MYLMNPKIIRRVIIAIFLLLIVGIVFYIATHGRVKITNVSASTLQAVNVEKDSSVYEIGNGGILPSGSYAVRNDLNGIQRVIYITVPNWFGEVTETFGKNPSAQTERLASLTYEHFFQGDSGSLVSYSSLRNYTTGYTIHQPDDAFGGKYTDVAFDDDLVNPVTTTNGQLLGEYQGKVSRYSFATKTMSPVADMTFSEPNRDELGGDITLMPKLQRSKDVSSGVVGLYEKANEKLSIIDSNDTATVHSVSVENSRSIVFDINDSGWAIADTTSKPKEVTTEEDEAETLDYKLIIYSNQQKKTTDLPIGDAQVISEVSLSPSGKFIAVLKDGKLWVYTTSDKKVVFSNPFTLSNRLFWNKDKLYSLSNESGISVYTPSNKQLLALDLQTEESLSFTDMTAIGSKLYFTAYTKNRDAELPDGYVIDFDLPKNNVTEVLAENLPYEGEKYDISYLKNTIYIRVNVLARSAADLPRIETIKKNALEKLHQLINEDTLKQCTVVYVT